MVRWKASRSLRFVGTEKMAPTSSRVRRRPISGAGLEADSGSDEDEVEGKPPSQAQ